MLPVDDVEAVYSDLRRLVTADPRAAHRAFNDLLDGGSASIEQLLRRISTPGEGRLRQLAANVARRRKDKDRLLPFLRQWSAVEPDEFTRRAIASALLDDATGPIGSVPDLGARPELLSETYRYVADRLCHRVRNALLGMDVALARLSAVAQIAQPEAQAVMSDTVNTLKEGLRRVGRIVEFDIDDEQFRWAAIPLVDWLRQMHARYVATYSAATLTVSPELADVAPVVRATPLLLDTLFWNLWSNAAQAAPGKCRIHLEGVRDGGGYIIDVLDSGPGFSSDAAQNVLRLPFSTRGEGRGRGLLEAFDAARQLHGRVEVRRHRDGTFRLRLFLPEVYS